MRAMAPNSVALWHDYDASTEIAGAFGSKRSEAIFEHECSNKGANVKIGIMEFKVGSQPPRSCSQLGGRLKLHGMHVGAQPTVGLPLVSARRR